MDFREADAECERCESMERLFDCCLSQVRVPGVELNPVLVEVSGQAGLVAELHLSIKTAPTQNLDPAQLADLLLEVARQIRIYR